MRTTPVLFSLLAMSCGPNYRIAGSNNAILQEKFAAATFKSDWAVVSPGTTGGSIQLEGGRIALTMSAGNSDEIVVRRKFDVLPVRGQRLRFTARVRTEAPAESFARATLTAVTAAAMPSYRDIGSTSPVNSGSWTVIHVVLDIPSSATAGQIDVILHGSGTAWFSDVEVVAVGASPAPAPIQLSSQQVANLTTFSRAAALIRYLHPSDQAASLDWNAFLPSAIDRVLRATSPSELLNELRVTFSQIAPTAVFSSAAYPASPLSLPGVDGSHLVRWRHAGIGASPFLAYREGRDPDSTSATAVTRLERDNLKACKELSLRASGRKLSGTGKVSLLASILLPGVKQQDITEPFSESGGEILLRTGLSADTQAVEIGLRAEGPSHAVIDTLVVWCDGHLQRTVDLAHSKWTYVDALNLYTWDIVQCNTGSCAMLRRKALDNVFAPARDVQHSDIGNGIIMDLPLAVWAGTSGTVPAVAAAPRIDDFAIDDLATRLAAVSAAWGTLWLFYPYFADQGIDWLAALPDALREAAAARSPRETHVALLHLNAHLRDNHANVTHPAAPMTGVLPILLRRFGQQLIVTGGVPEYVKSIGIGSDLEEIDGISAIQAYDQAVTQISPATDGLREYLAPIRMGAGVPGTFRRLRTRDRDGKVTYHVLPLVPSELYRHANREVRPANGAELAPGIFYLDLDELSVDAWNKLLPRIEHAHALILDLRGYVTAATLEVMSHITDQALHSPIWQTPLVPSVDGRRYAVGRWDVRPQSPRLDAKVIALIDARAISAVETVLQMFSENKLGILVGEPSGGTNGNATYVELPGGYRIRFTGMRASTDTGATVQGRGFQPDHFVHPTVEGIRNGRDEILEVGVATAKRLIGP